MLLERPIALWAMPTGISLVAHIGVVWKAEGVRLSQARSSCNENGGLYEVTRMSSGSVHAALVLITASGSAAGTNGEQGVLDLR